MLPEGAGVGGAFVAQLTGVLVITVWTVLATGIVWGVLEAVGQSRVTPQHEQDGLDVSEHGVETYPEFGAEDNVVADGGIVRADGSVVETHASDSTDGGEN